MKPSILHAKLQDMGVDGNLCDWVMDYLRERVQKVKVGNELSESQVTTIGAPQGCVLSPVLFTAYTNSHRGQEPHSIISKYADDAALIGFIRDNNESHYPVKEFVSCCDSDELLLNTSKTKEMIVDFRKGIASHEPLSIKGDEVERVDEYDYLGTRTSKNMSWAPNIRKLTSKAMKRLYHLRKLRDLKVKPEILKLFYTTIIESVMTFGIAIWGGNLGSEEKRMLNRVQRYGRRICGGQVTSWSILYTEKAKQLARKTIKDSLHPLNQYFKYLPSGRRLSQLKNIRTKRFRRSFVPNAISLLN